MSLNPVWNESFLIDIQNVNVLELKIKDWDRFLLFFFFFFFVNEIN